MTHPLAAALDNLLLGSSSGPATPEDLEAELRRAVRAGELEEGAGRRLLGMAASMRTPQPDPAPDTTLQDLEDLMAKTRRNPK